MKLTALGQQCINFLQFLDCVVNLQVMNASFLDVDESCLSGYIAGCSSVLGRLDANAIEHPLTLYQKVVASVRNNFQVSLDV